MTTYYKYMEDVLAGRVLVGNWIKLAVERHYNDLDYGADRGIYFDEKEANRRINTIKLLRHTKGSARGKHFIPEPHQAFEFALFFGWKRDDGTRRFRKVLDCKARKNGKTEEAAAVACSSFMWDNEWGSEIYFAATQTKQATIGFQAAKSFLKQLQNDSPKARRMLDILTYAITIPDMDSKMTAVSSEHDKMDGYSPQGAIIDEFHAHKTTGVLDVMETGQGERLQPFIWIPTTAGSNSHSPCRHLEKVCEDILLGIKEDDEMLAFLWHMDEADLEDENWKNPELWVKPNPNMGVSVRTEYLTGQFRKAINEGGAKEVQFKTKNLNIWTTSASTWIQDDAWMKCKLEFTLEQMKGRPCFGGLDLASVKDLAALVLVFPPVQAGEPYKFLAWHWCPKGTAKFRQENDGIPYMQWAENGSLHLTDRRSTDFRFIKQTILELSEVLDIKMIGYDQANAYQLANELEDEGIPMEVHGQGFISMNFPTKELERMILAGTIAHTGSQIMRWQCSNVALKIDPADNYKIDKDKSSEKVDGMVALVMGISMAVKYKDKVSVYENRGVAVIG